MGLDGNDHYSDTPEAHPGSIRPSSDIDLITTIGPLNDRKFGPSEFDEDDLGWAGAALRMGRYADPPLARLETHDNRDPLCCDLGRS